MELTKQLRRDLLTKLETVQRNINTLTKIQENNPYLNYDVDLWENDQRKKLLEQAILDNELKNW